MKLQELLTQNITKLTPQAIIIIKRSAGRYTAQNVDDAPELLNLGVVLLGYYHDPERVTKLARLGDCLSVAHYLQAPRTLKYGRDFAHSPRFKALPGKLQKHLTGEIQDCTISFSRDFGIQRPAANVQSLAKFLTSKLAPYVYLYQDQRWQLLRANSRNESRPVSLRNQIRQLLNGKA